MTPNARLIIDARPAALCAGGTVRGFVVLTAVEPLEARSLRIQAAGREVIGAHPRYLPVVYLRPVPRPWGRTRSGHARLLYQLDEPLPVTWPDQLEAGWQLPAGSRTPLAPGTWAFPFKLTLPADALPTYGGLNAVIEHELTAVLETDRGRLTAWLPLHLWAPPAEVGAAEPVVVTAEAAGDTAVDWLVRRWRPPVRLTVTVPSSTVDLRLPLAVSWVLENPRRRPLRHLVLELSAIERTRHMAATDLHEMPVSRRMLPVPDRRDWRGEVEWDLPQRVAPSFQSERIRLAWRLSALVTQPWALGISAAGEVTLVDGGAGVEDSMKGTGSRVEHHDPGRERRTPTPEQERQAHG